MSALTSPESWLFPALLELLSSTFHGIPNNAGKGGLEGQKRGSLGKGGGSSRRGTALPTHCGYGPDHQYNFSLEMKIVVGKICSHNVMLMTSELLRPFFIRLTSLSKPLLV